MNFKAGLVLWVEDNESVTHLAEIELHELSGIKTTIKKGKRNVGHLHQTLGKFSELLNKQPQEQPTKRRVFTKDTVKQIIQMRLDGHQPATIAKQFNTTNTQVSAMLYRAKGHNQKINKLLNTRYHRRKGK